MDCLFNIKDAETNLSFSEIKWLNTNVDFDDDDEIEPNEILYDESSKSKERVFLAKYENNGIEVFGTRSIDNVTRLNYSILKLNKNSFYWQKIGSSPHLFPKYAFRAAYDMLYKNFTFIARLRKDNNLCKFGLIVNICDYMPAIVFQIFDKVTRNCSTKLLNLNSLSDINNYEILCLKSSPASLKNLCVNRILSLESKYYETNRIFTNLFHTRLEETLPKVVCDTFWPYRLNPNENLKKLNKLRSQNSMFELNISENGLLRIRKYFKITDQQDFYFYTNYIYEKNVESFVLCKYGVMIIYDYRQETRRPSFIFEFKKNDDFKKGPLYLELSDDGHLKLVNVRLGQELIILDLNDFITNEPYVYYTTSLKITSTANRIQEALQLNLDTLNQNKKFFFKMIEYTNNVKKFFSKIYTKN